MKPSSLPEMGTGSDALAWRHVRPRKEIRRVGGHRSKRTARDAEEDSIAGSSTGSYAEDGGGGAVGGGVAHDFNNLLMVISSQAELLLETTDRGKVEGKAKRILSATDSAGQLTRKLLAFGRKQELASSTST